MTLALGHEKREVPAKTDPRIPGEPRARVSIDVTALERALAKAVRGEVRFDAGSKALYATDASNFRQTPIGVVIPKDLDDVVAAHRICAEYDAPLLNRGCGTSLSGETVNYAVVIDNSKYLTKMGELDTDQRTITVETGVINEHVNLKTGPDGLVFGPDPSTHSRCTIGGNIGNNSCGVHSIQSEFYGPGPRTSDNVKAMEIVTYGGDRFWVGVDEEKQLPQIIAAGGPKGEIYRQLRDLRDRYADAIRAGYPPVTEVPRRVSGFNLDELLPEKGFNVARALIGTESTCATALQVVLELTPALLKRTLVVVFYPDIVDACQHVMEIRAFRPIGIEAIDTTLIDDQQQLGINSEDIEELPRGGGKPDDTDGCWLMVQFGADNKEESEAQAGAFVAWLTEHGYSPDRYRVMKSKQEGGTSEDLWQIRESGLGSTAFPPDGEDHWPGWEDSAVPPKHMGDYLAELMPLMDRYGIRGAMYGHFGQGCLHSRMNFDLRHPNGLKQYRAFLEEAAQLVAKYGGSISGEHGDGQQRAELLRYMFSDEVLDAMREFKRIWDPKWKMNPGKVIDAYKLDENLKLGTNYNPSRPSTKFSFQQDKGDFAHAMLRCVGVGKCRVPDATQTMCPSFQVTREEKHSTRGRARLLFEMLQGDIITEGWQSTEVKEALDLCLACKGCTNDCPVDVDMPTYKAEFLHHHYRSLRRWRPRYAYAMGFIDQAARVAALVPEVANFFGQTPGLARLLKIAGGVDRKRPVPKFAPMTLQQWFERRGGTKNPYGPRVVVFPDTFNNHFHTDVGVAAVEAIENAGWQVVMPQGHICCGRPLYDYGFLDQAQRYLHNVLDMLRDEIREGTPIVGIEPSCLAVFKDELTKMLPHDDDASRLSRNAYHFTEFFEKFDIEVPQLDRKAVMWGHCHHRATGGMDAEEKLLSRMGVEVDSVKGGCCGLAGSWGFEQGKHGISMDCGEQALFPAVRDAPDDTLIVANGFSCKTQIKDAKLGRKALHVAQVMAMAREEGPKGHTKGKPEKGATGSKPKPPVSLRLARMGAVVAGGAAAVATARAAVRRA